MSDYANAYARQEGFPDSAAMISHIQDAVRGNPHRGSALILQSAVLVALSVIDKRMQ